MMENDEYVFFSTEIKTEAALGNDYFDYHTFLYSKNDKKTVLYVGALNYYERELTYSYYKDYIDLFPSLQSVCYYDPYEDIYKDSIYIKNQTNNSVTLSCVFMFLPHVSGKYQLAPLVITEKFYNNMRNIFDDTLSEDDWNFLYKKIEKNDFEVNKNLRDLYETKGIPFDKMSMYHLIEIPDFADYYKFNSYGDTIYLKRNPSYYGKLYNFVDNQLYKKGYTANFVRKELKKLGFDGKNAFGVILEVTVTFTDDDYNVDIEVIAENKYQS